MNASRAALAACLLITGRAGALEPPATAVGTGSTGGDMIAEPPEADREPPHPARDTLGGHLTISAGGGLLIPTGALAEGAKQFRLLDPSGGLSLDIGYGLSRTTVLALSGQLGLLRGDDRCAGCSARTIAVGPTFRYHLVQGLAFDPWVSAGIAFRSTSFEADENTTYLGLDWARFAVGGNWYPSPYAGFGPYLELNLGHFLDGSGEDFDRGGVAAHFMAGLRAAFDLAGR